VSTVNSGHNPRYRPRTRRWRTAFVGLLALTATASPAAAQNYSFDARRIALGGAGGTPNVASKLVERQRRYKSILIPVGMVKVLTNVRVFYPTREDFRFIKGRGVRHQPLHFVFGRSEDITFKSFFADIVRAQLKSDLNEYKEDFEKPLITEAEGQMDVTWGKTFMLRQSERSYQGIYVGAGPYLGSVAHFNYDSEFEKIVSDTGERLVPNARLGIDGGETAQLALDVTGAYRARFPLFGGDGEAARRNGMYVAANYHHLQGFRLDQFNAQLNLDTDPDGLLLPHAPEMPFTLEWYNSNKGVGLSMDFGVAFVAGRWDFGTGVSGVANRIKWRDITRQPPCAREPVRRHRVRPRQATPHGPHNDRRDANHLHRRPRLSPDQVVVVQPSIRTGWAAIIFVQASNTGSVRSS
jgi:hypothetical protein